LAATDCALSEHSVPTSCRVTGQSGRDAGHAGRKKMIRTIVSTDDSIATTILRLVLGVVFFAHGAQRWLGWFCGFGFAGTMGFFSGDCELSTKARSYGGARSGLKEA